MQTIKIETYYDIGCEVYASHRNTDFEMGMETSQVRLKALAKAEGWTCKYGQTICPRCAERNKEELK